LKFKDIKFNKALRELLEKPVDSDVSALNKTKSFLILFEGSDDYDMQEVQSFSDFLKRNGKSTKLLSFIDSKGELIDFGMAVYNNSTLNWYEFPKEHIFKLLETSVFDVMINLNINDRRHLHALACKANAKFKISLPTIHPHNFTLIIDTKEKQDIKLQIDEIIAYFDIFAI
jgi:hypothetical protein